MFFFLLFAQLKMSNKYSEYICEKCIATIKTCAQHIKHFQQIDVLWTNYLVNYNMDVDLDKKPDIDTSCWESNLQKNVLDPIYESAMVLIKNDHDYYLSEEADEPSQCLSVSLTTATQSSAEDHSKIISNPGR